MARVSLGSVCSGSTLPEDIIPALVDELDEIREQIAEPGPTTEQGESVQGRVATVSALDTFLGDLERRMEEDGYYEDSEAASEDLDTLINHLNDHAPPYVSFGTHKGDGADYGWWPDHDRIAEDRESGELASGEDLPEQGEDGELFLHVSDHGNIELYMWGGISRAWKSVWSCV